MIVLGIVSNILVLATHFCWYQHASTPILLEIVKYELGVVRNLPIFFRNENWSFGGEGVWCLFVSEIISIVDLCTTCTCTVVNGVCTICARCICTDTIVT